MSFASISEIFAQFGDKPAQQARVVAEKLGAEFQAVRMWPQRGRVPDEYKLQFIEVCKSAGVKGVTLELLTRLSAARTVPEKTQGEAAA